MHGTWQGNFVLSEPISCLFTDQFLDTLLQSRIDVLFFSFFASCILILSCFICYRLRWGGGVITSCFFSQSFVIVRINVPHWGHLCVVLLNVSMQKGMRQQPAAQLQEKKQNKQIWKHVPLTVRLAAQMETSPTSSHYILMQMFPQNGRNVFIPNHG